MPIESTVHEWAAFVEELDEDDHLDHDVVIFDGFHPSNPLHPSAWQGLSPDAIVDIRAGMVRSYAHPARDLKTMFMDWRERRWMSYLSSSSPATDDGAGDDVVLRVGSDDLPRLLALLDGAGFSHTVLRRTAPDPYPQSP